MIRAVLDANVLASGLLALHPNAPSFQIQGAWRTKVFQIVISEVIVSEVIQTLQKRYFKQRLSTQEIAEGLEIIRRTAEFSALTVVVEGVATHPEDDLVLSTAASANADYLVTGDAGLLAIRWYGNTQIVSPREFLDILNAAST